MKDTTTFLRDKLTLSHSSLVACAAAKIAKFLPEEDPDVTYQCGLFHDIGKLYLFQNEFYKHPFLGFSLMTAAHEPLLAAVCLWHSFPLGPKDFPYLLHYCHGDSQEAQRLQEQMVSLTLDFQTIERCRLIQFCDKISGHLRFIRLDEKEEWYRRQDKIDNKSLRKNFEALREIKDYLDCKANQDVYKILGLYN
jgi:putative nucleotidyltransferase with HDIG domain